MIVPGWWDHAFATLLLVVWPAWAAFQGRDGLRKLEEGEEDRASSYRLTMLVQWSQALLLLGGWWLADRSWQLLGLTGSLGWGFWLSATLAVAALGAVVYQFRRRRRDAAYAARLREQVEGVQAMIPQNASELRAFRAMAVTAGFCEELTCRGFVLWYLGAYMHPFLAVLAMAVAFGLSHLYQGIQGALQIAVIACIAAGLYWLSGSLWVPIVLHALFDAAQLELARAALAESDPAPTDPDRSAPVHP